ncbi:hypothetical protein [Paraburkholderia sp. 32]|uniref:hypothetical protein n=1 Tax=Paraburkholderia sp. 32 TaxID=2991057 RepID=UPI003D21119A
MREVSESGVLARLTLLERVLDAPRRTDEAVIQACGTQRGLAALTLPDEKIRPMSLNCMKSVAAFAIEDGGWPRLDRLRRTVHTMRKQGTRKNRMGKDSKERRTETELLAEADRGRLRLARAYTELLALADKYVKDEGREPFARHQATWREQLGMSVVES